MSIGMRWKTKFSTTSVASAKEMWLDLLLKLKYLLPLYNIITKAMEYFYPATTMFFPWYQHSESLNVTQGFGLD